MTLKVFLPGQDARTPNHKAASALTVLRADAAAVHEAFLTDKPRGPVSGLRTLDRALSGAFEPGLHILHGNAGVGKTALALQIAAECQCPALFVTCQMLPVELLRRHTARVTGTYLGRLKSGEIPDEDVERLAVQAMEVSSDMAFVDATWSIAPVEYIQECALAVRGESKHLLIVLDTLHTWTQPNGVASSLAEYEVLNVAIRSLQMMAAKLVCPVLVVSERNRESMGKGGVNAGAGTRKIEYLAETVISLERDPALLGSIQGDVEISLNLEKNRHGSIGGRVPLYFNGALQKFSETVTSRR